MATYYVSNTGNDSHAGTSSGTAWQTISKVNSSSFSPDDFIGFECGGIWNEALIITSSGSSGHPITFGSYGSGAKPIISGFISLSSWTNTGGNMYQSNTSITTAANIPMVTVDDSYQLIGTYPKSSYPAFQSHSGTASITSNAISSYPSFVGGNVMIFPNLWTTDKYSVSGQTSTTVTFGAFIPTVEGGKNYGAQTISDGQTFVFENHANACTAQGDWYLDGSNKLNMYSSGTPSGVKIANIDTLVTINDESYITFSNINITGANMYCVWIGTSSASYITFDSCDLSFAAVNGVYFRGSGVNNVLFNSCTVSYCNNNGLEINDGTYCTIQYCDIGNIGQAFGVSQSGQNMYGIGNVGANGLVQYSNVYNTGYTGIRFGGSNTTIQNNYVHDAMTISNDGALIYTYGGQIAGGDGTTNKSILNNICINSNGNGIYLDGDASYVLVQGNTVSGCIKNGFYCNSGTYDTILYNTFYNNYLTQFQIDKYASGHTPVGWTVTNNIFFAKDYSLVISLQNEADNTNPTGWGTFDYNYYCRPIFEPDGIVQNPCFNTYIYNYCTNGGTMEFFGSDNANRSDYSLDQWKIFLGQDAHSNKSPFSVDNVNKIRFEYNATNASVDVNLGHVIYEDVTGATYTGVTAISAYSSLVLLDTGRTTRVFGPLLLTTTYTTNIYNNASSLLYDNIRQITVVNDTGGAATFRLYLGATGANAAGTELFYNQNVAANSKRTFTFNPGLRMSSTDFLVGGASADNTLTILGIGTQFVT